MAVYRVNKNRGYTVMANFHLRDKSLSLKAVGLLSDVYKRQVREQTQLEDMEVIEKYRKSVVSPNAKNSPEVVKLANTLLSRVRETLQQSAEKVLKLSLIHI